jgi:polygalacturonase
LDDNVSNLKELVPKPTSLGGGHVVVPAGEFLTGAVHLKSGVDLHLETNAVLEIQHRPTNYLPLVFTRFEGTELYNYSPLIYALGQKNVALTGDGTIDGQADDSNWMAWKNTKSRATLVKMATDGVPVEQRQFGEASTCARISSSSTAAKMF